MNNSSIIRAIDNCRRAGVPPDCDYTIDISEVMACRDRQEYHRIVSDPKLFLSLFYQAISATAVRNESLSISQKERILAISGSLITIYTINSTIEIIRKVFEKGLKEQKPVCIVFGKATSSHTFILEQSDSPIINLSDPGLVGENNFLKYIDKALVQSAKYLKAACSLSILQREYTLISSHKSNSIKNISTLSYFIEWSEQASKRM